MNPSELSNIDSIINASKLKERVMLLSNGTSELLRIAQESFLIGSKSHLNSLNPDLREELGLQMVYLTERDPKLSNEYKEKKNQYLSLGKSYAAISFLFDLVDEYFSLLDIVLLQEILMDDGEFRKEKVFIQRPSGEKISFDSSNILGEIEEVFLWYYSMIEDNTISPIVIAVLFHYKLVTIHPFLDGNGRISRLVLNLILLKNGYFPISIPNTKRKEYYECLVKADDGEFEPLVSYFAKLLTFKLNQYITISHELSTVADGKECLVLTEDGNTEMLASILKIHGIDINKVELESYDGKDNLASAIFFANKLLSKYPSLKKVLIHRDRDNDNPQQIKQIIRKNLKNYGIEERVIVLVTKFYDIESYFLDPRHINEIYPDISIRNASRLIAQATQETSETSKSKLRIAYSEYGRFGQITDPLKKAEEINDLYDSDPEKFRYGKSVLYRLEELIGSEIGSRDKVHLAKQSVHIRIGEIEKLKEAIN